MDVMYMIPRYNSPGIFVQNTTTNPPVIEKLLGTNVTGSVSASPAFAGTAGNSSTVTATWTGAAASATVTNVYGKFSEWDTLPTDYKLCLWSSSGVLLMVTNPRTLTSGDMDTYQTFTVSSSVSITKGVSYMYGWINSAGAQKVYVDTAGGSSFHYGGAGTYAAPGNFTNTDVLQDPALVCIYFEGNTA